MHRLKPVATLTAVVVVALTGCGGKTVPSVEQTKAKTHAAPAAATHSSNGTALAALDMLAIKGRAPKTGYSREQFGDGWASVAGCDMRDRMLGRDLTRRQVGETSESLLSTRRRHLNLKV